MKRIGNLTAYGVLKNIYTHAKHTRAHSWHRGNTHYQQPFLCIVQKKFTERLKYCRRASETISPNLREIKLFSHLFHLRFTDSHPSPWSTEHWNTFFHFSAASCWSPSSERCEAGACARQQAFGSCFRWQTWARMSISIMAAAPATDPWPGWLSLETKKKF